MSVEKSSKIMNLLRFSKNDPQNSRSPVDEIFEHGSRVVVLLELWRHPIKRGHIANYQMERGESICVLTVDIHRGRTSLETKSFF